jgi:hypothetical protein
MKLNPYSIILIGIFIITVSISNKTLKNKKYEKTTNDSCVCPDDSTVFIRKM